MAKEPEKIIQDCIHLSQPTAPKEAMNTHDNDYKCPATGAWIELKSRDGLPVCMYTSCHLHVDESLLSEREKSVYLN